MTWGKIIQWRRRRSTSATAGFKFKSPSPEQYPRSDNKPLVPVLPSWAPGNELSHTGGSWTLDVGQVYTGGRTGGLHVERVSCILISFFVRFLLCLAICFRCKMLMGQPLICTEAECQWRRDFGQIESINHPTVPLSRTFSFPLWLLQSACVPPVALEHSPALQSLLGDDCVVLQDRPCIHVFSAPPPFPSKSIVR